MNPQKWNIISTENAVLEIIEKDEDEKEELQTMEVEISRVQSL